MVRYSVVICLAWMEPPPPLPQVQPTQLRKKSWLAPETCWLYWSSSREVEPTQMTWLSLPSSKVSVAMAAREGPSMSPSSLE